MSEQSSTDDRRRHFLLGGLVAGAGVTLAGVALTDSVTDDDKAASYDPDKPNDQATKGYHVTPHIEAYYRSASN